MEESLGMLQFLLLMHNTSLITVLFGLSVVTDESTLLRSLKVELDVSSLNLMIN